MATQFREGTRRRAVLLDACRSRSGAMSRARGATSARSGSGGRSQETGVDVDVVYRSFELDPTVPTGGDSPLLVDYLARKFGDRSRVQAAHARLTDAGAELGIDFRWSGMRRANTFDAHRLLAWALHDHGADEQRALKQRAAARVLHRRRSTWPTTPCWPTLAADVGLDRGGGGRARWRPTTKPTSCDAEREEAYGNGINAVPTFIVEGEWMLQGALDTDKWVKALTHIQAELAQT